MRDVALCMQICVFQSNEVKPSAFLLQVHRACAQADENISNGLKELASMVSDLQARPD